MGNIFGSNTEVDQPESCDHGNHGNNMDSKDDELARDSDSRHSITSERNDEV